MNGTSCGKCIFAEWGNDFQTGCTAGRLKKFIERGEKLELVKTDRTHFFIHDRMCTMCCQQSLLDNNEDIRKNPLQEIRKRIALKCEALVLVEEHNIEDIEKTVISLIRQEHKPMKITVVVNSNNQKPPKIARIFRQNNEGIVWQITNIEERGPNNELVSMEWCVDHVLKASQAPFYTIFESGYKVPASFLKDIDMALNDELHKFAVLRPIDDWNGTFCQTALHNRIEGYAPMVLRQEENGDELIGLTVYDKAHFLAEQEGQAYMVRSVTEICPVMN